MKSPQSVYLDHEHCVWKSGNLLVTLSDAPPSKSYMTAWSNETDKIVEAHGSLINCIVISDTASVPSEQAREQVRLAMTRHQDAIVASAFVVQASGFIAAAMRSAVSLTGLVARFPFPQKTFGSVTEAGSWLERLARDRDPCFLQVGTVKNMVDAMRSKLDTARSKSAPAS